VTNKPINYYEIDIKAFEKNIYPGQKPTQMTGYDGMSPGPTFIVEKGEESVVRFTNKAENESAIHLHGSYSVRLPSGVLAAREVLTSCSAALGMDGRRMLSKRTSTRITTGRTARVLASPGTMITP
jgi:multicopper oxidase